MKYEVKFNKKLYRKKAIKIAVNSFQKLAKFTVKNDKDYFIVLIQPFYKEVEDTIKDEFNNFVLAHNSL
ncbi:MAG: HxsD-like protein [Microgenomates group bacterium]